jgi:hypothetical protein
MNFEKIKYSKCPGCKKHGIHSFKKIYRRHNSILTCKCCGGKFQVNFALSIIVKIIGAIVWGILASIFNKYIFFIPIWIWFLTFIVAFLLFEYFAPLEEVKE